ncbi:MAG: 3-phenylpropionate/trans-cinnamate dioxygenase ferredoxin reductase component [Frankiales bacterium]|nr:3-phenylpropionate/trans-cinnamate dioxygenase ferredoxin reductase component [Frankiales bacterium]
MTHGVVIVGASLAGAHAALSLRRLGYQQPVTLVGAESWLPYERPELSKGFLAGTVTEDALFVATQQDYDDAAIELRLGTTATGVDVPRRRLLLEGDEVPFDALVIATGSSNITPRLPGIDLPGVLQLRTLDDAETLGAAAEEAGRVVVMGTGLVGCEVAATLNGRGLQVTALDLLPGPLWALLGPELSDLVRGWHEEHGVQIVGGTGVVAIEGAGRVERVVLTDGRTLDADLVVVGVGARPAIRWLQDVPLHLDAGGVGVDPQLRTSLESVYAAGDVAAVWDPAAAKHRRVEHYNSAVEQGDRVAHVIAGVAVPSIGPTWFWSRQFGHYLQYAGEHGPGDVLVRRPDPFAAFFRRGDVLRAVATVDNGRDLRRALKLLGRVVDPDLLADPSVDLRTLLDGPERRP